MLTNNYYKMKGFFDSHTNRCDGFSRASISVIDTSGTTYTNLSYASNNNESYAAGANANYCMKMYLVPYLGTGDTEPSVYDYALNTDVTSSISNLSMSITSTGEDDKISTILLITGVNNTSESITIKEIGIAKKVSRIYDNNSGAYDPAIDSSAPHILLDHTLLENPVTVAPGSNLSLTLEWIEQ